MQRFKCLAEHLLTIFFLIVLMGKSGLNGNIRYCTPSHLDRSTQQEKDQVEERESRQQVLHFWHGSSMFSVLLVHHHHVDHQAHDRNPEQQIKQERLTPTAGTGHRVKLRFNTAVNTLYYSSVPLALYGANIMHFKIDIIATDTCRCISFW